MTSTGNSEFDQFAESLNRWRTLGRPIGNLDDAQAQTYEIDMELDHVVSYLSSLGDRALRGDTQIDWASTVPSYLADLDKIETGLGATRISEIEKQRYQDYLTECRLVWERMRLLPVPREGHLGFRKAVLDEFRFLAEEFQFRVVRHSPINVRYESTALFVELTYSPDSPEISLAVGRLPRTGECEEAFYLDDITYMAGLGSFDFEDLDLKTQHGVALFVKSAAEVVREHLGDVLRNDVNAFRLLRDMATERDKRYSDKMKRQHGPNE
jgi:hypothetical protein